MANTQLHMFLPKVKTIYDLTIYQIGYEKCAPDHFFGPVIRDFYVMHFLISGKGIYRVRNREYELGRGDCFLVVPNEKTFYRAQPDDPYEYFWVAFHGTGAKEILTNADFYTDNNFIYRHPEEYETIYSLMAQMNNITDSTTKNNIRLQGFLYQLLGLMVKKDEEYDSSPTNVNTAERINQYVSANYQQDISIDSLARFANMHRSSLYRYMKKNFGVSPIEFVINYRLEKALFMLKNSERNTSQIAFACGFNDTACFCKAFKKKFKKTPSEARKLV